MPSGRLVGIGAFVLGGALLFAIGLFVIGERRMMFEPQFEVFTEFADLSGLQTGATVSVGGMAAGEVTDITAPADPSGRFRVRMRVRRQLHPLVRMDSIASIRTEGVVGSRFLHISIGTSRVPVASEGGTIPSREPFDVTEVLDRISETVTNFNDAIVAVRVEIQDVLRVIATAGADADALIREVGSDVRAITEAGNKITSDIEAMVAGVREGRGTIGRIVNDDELYRHATAIAADAEAAVRAFREATDQANATVRRFAGEGGTAEGISNDLRAALERANAALTNIEETSEALKHNWFFRGYFRRRGYFNLSDISPAQYLQGVLEENNRVPLRIWLKADLLFSEGPDGKLVVTQGGAARLDSAMTEFLEYTGPVMVEGYSTGPSAAERVVASQRRATAARDYLIQRFDLDPGNIGIMPLGARAKDSPAGDTWDGIALTIFVEKDAIRL